ncbi:AAA family ATPase [Teredinibacter turnerae]|uniref:AAA family ATPase n=1 Tax=Teredinibacter turnerae TaxID=2426 RepID=UPI000478001A|nr:AAA family ATPase [Teredinibacter turnerae]
MSRPQMFLVAGVNGSGKSTLTKTILRKHPTLKVIDPDAIAKGMTGSFATIDAEQVSAGKMALMTVQQCLERRQSFIVESTISGRVYLRYLQLAREKGFKTIIVYVALESPEMSAERVAARVTRGGHNIPAEDIKRRYPKSFQNLKAHLQLADIAYIYDNSKEYSLVASYRDGLMHRQKDLPSFLNKYL